MRSIPVASISSTDRAPPGSVAARETARSARLKRSKSKASPASSARRAEPGGLGLDGPVEPPGGDRGPLDEDGAGVGGGPPVVVPGLELGLELGGVLAGEDGVHGAEAVGHAVELGDVLALGGGGAARFCAVDSARLALLLGTHGCSALSCDPGGSPCATSRAASIPMIVNGAGIVLGKGWHWWLLPPVGSPARTLVGRPASGTRRPIGARRPGYQRARRSEDRGSHASPCHSPACARLAPHPTPRGGRGETSRRCGEGEARPRRSGPRRVRHADRLRSRPTIEEVRTADPAGGRAGGRAPRRPLAGMGRRADRAQPTGDSTALAGCGIMAAGGSPCSSGSR